MGYIKRIDLLKAVNSVVFMNTMTRESFRHIIRQQPNADVVEVETIKAWLYEMAINNVGCTIDGDFSNACEEIIKRLDGLRQFAKEREEQRS